MSSDSLTHVVRLSPVGRGAIASLSVVGPWAVSVVDELLHLATRANFGGRPRRCNLLWPLAIGSRWRRGGRLPARAGSRGNTLPRRRCRGRRDCRIAMRSRLPRARLAAASARHGKRFAGRSGRYRPEASSHRTRSNYPMGTAQWSATSCHRRDSLTIGHRKCRGGKRARAAAAGSRSVGAAFDGALARRVRRTAERRQEQPRQCAGRLSARRRACYAGHHARSGCGRLCTGGLGSAIDRYGRSAGTCRTVGIGRHRAGQSPVIGSGSGGIGVRR